MTVTFLFTLWFIFVCFLSLWHIAVTFISDSLTSSQVGVNSVMKETLFRNHWNCSVDWALRIEGISLVYINVAETSVPCLELSYNKLHLNNKLVHILALPYYHIFFNFSVISTRGAVYWPFCKLKSWKVSKGEWAADRFATIDTLGLSCRVITDGGKGGKIE